MLKFSKEFFNEEEREGFVVSSAMKRAWAMQMEILRIIDEVCEKHDIKYFVFWGTMLGAIRHKGFVPWDDDMDIMMKREDYDRFIEVASEELPEGYALLSIYSEYEWNLATARVTNGFTLSYEDDFLKSHYLCPYVCGIDVFPYDYLPDDKETFKTQENFLDGITMVRDLLKEKEKQLSETGQYDKEIDEKAEFVLRDLEKYFKFEFNRDNNMENQILCFFDQVCAAYGKPTDKYMTGHIERRAREDQGGKFLIPTFCFDESIDYPFEGYTVKVPKYYEICLSRCYGPNFMTPIKGGASHDYPFYKIQDEKLKDLGKYEGCVEAVERLSKLESDDNTIAEYITEIPKNTVTDAAADAETQELRALISDWKAPDKKAILCCFSIMDAYEAEEKFVKKLKDTIDFFKDQTEKICMILLVAPYVEEILARKSAALSEEYINLMNSMIQSEWALAVFPDQYYGIVDLCDAYYGSPNEYIKPFQDAKKPIMVQNMDILNS